MIKPSVIVSLHDVTPFYEREIGIIMERFRDVPMSYLITPDWHSRNPLTPSFARIFDGKDTLLHGFTHSGKPEWISNFVFRSTGITRELNGLTRGETEAVIRKGLEAFRSAFGKVPEGFVPPNWHHNRHSVSVLKELGFRYTEGSFAVTDLVSGKRHFDIPISFDFGNNLALSGLAFRLSHFGLRSLRFGWLRFAIHPMDVRRGFLERIADLVALMRDKGYGFLTYPEWLAESASA
jgi:hypothetical protein